MKNFLNHARIYIFRGLLAIIPLVLSYLAIRFFYVMIDKKVVGWLNHFIGFSVPGLGILLVLVFLYVLGFVASNVIGKNLFLLIEQVTSRIPIIKTVYKVGKQLSLTLSLPEKQIFKRVVLIEFFKPGYWTLGFVTGTLIDRTTNEQLLKIFVPTTPNPTSGWVVVARESDIRESGWSVEEAMKLVISGGIIGPEEIKPINERTI